MYHYTAKTNSDHLVDFQTSSLKVIAGNSKTLLIKIHGNFKLQNEIKNFSSKINIFFLFKACIMVISWIFLASIGIMFARLYFRILIMT